MQVIKWMNSRADRHSFKLNVVLSRGFPLPVLQHLCRTIAYHLMSSVSSLTRFSDTQSASYVHRLAPPHSTTTNGRSHSMLKLVTRFSRAILCRRNKLLRGHSTQNITTTSRRLFQLFCFANNLKKNDAIHALLTLRIV